MKNKSLIIIVIQAVMIVMLVWIILILGMDEFIEEELDNDEGVIVDYTRSIDDLTYVTLPLVVEKNSGITTIPIQSSTKSYDYSSYGEVMSLSDLFLKKNKLIFINDTHADFCDIISETDSLTVVNFLKENKLASQLRLKNLKKDSITIKKTGSIKVKDVSLYSYQLPLL